MMKTQRVQFNNRSSDRDGQTWSDRPGLTFGRRKAARKNVLLSQAFKLFCFIFLLTHSAKAQQSSRTFSESAQDLTDSYSTLYKNFKNPPPSARPWVFWYWMHASVTKAGITADLEAMKQAGIGGAYLMPIKDVLDSISIKPAIRQLSPEWWDMVKHSLQEAKRLGLEIGMHISDGFALAGGPWITPELSMQKVVWADTMVKGGHEFSHALPQPKINEGYYKDIAVYAFPTPVDAGYSTQTIIPKISTSTGANAQFLINKNNRQNFGSNDSCWIQYEFDQPFTCRHIVIRTSGNNYQSHRLMIEVSDDGKNFRSIGRLQPPRHGWQDTDADVTHVIRPTTARFFRFIYNKAGSEPGSEDLDAAKWSPSLKIRGIELSGVPRIHQYEGKNGSVWRVSERTANDHLPDRDCIPKNQLINITQYLSKDGRLIWKVPEGNWTILRMGHTSTGHTNATGGAGKGLECDKFNPDAVRLQFNGWFGEAVRRAGPGLTKDVLKVMHVDSWECGSQNWSPVFREQFKKRRGYDPLLYLPVMAGIPINNDDFSEVFLYDIRKTIAELVVDQFYNVLAKEAKNKGCSFSAESVAPTMMSDGLLHYQSVDLPMGEFWLRSPTHDKPNDMLDAISGGHIYGKKIIQAESFTELRMAWDEHPGMLKTIGDRNYALGINKLVYHVFTHNPWLDRKPGMTLDAIGLYFQRDQTWWKQGKAWVNYAQRSQALLQSGKPVVDIAVFTGEELPRRSVLPDRLVSSLPGIFGDSVVQKEKIRLANIGEPLRQIPAGVRHSANMTDPEDWIDPLNGYAYDSYNPDALLRLSKVNNGRIELPGGSSYGLLVIPGTHKMSPGRLMSIEAAAKILELANEGATVLIADKPQNLQRIGSRNDILQSMFSGLWTSGPANESSTKVIRYGKGSIITGAYRYKTFDSVGLQQDFIVTDDDRKKIKGIAWTHRTGIDYDLYFISNQDEKIKKIEVSLRQSGRIPEIWDPVTGDIYEADQWKIDPVKKRTHIPVLLDKNASLFIVLHKPAKQDVGAKKINSAEQASTVAILDKNWQVNFGARFGGPKHSIIFDELEDWSKHTDSSVKYYSGTAVYTKEFEISGDIQPQEKYFLELGRVANIGEVIVNKKNCGIVWTYPYRIDITKGLKKGSNKIMIEVTNTWANRLIGDQRLPEGKRVTNTTAPFRLGGKPLLEAGLLGPVKIIKKTSAPKNL